MKKLLFFISIIIFVSLLCFLSFFMLNPITISNISYSSLNPDNSLTIYMDISNDYFDSLYSIDGNEWIKPVNGKCEFNVNDGDYKLKVKNSFTNDYKEIQIKINEITKVTINTHEYYLAPGESYNLRLSFEVIGDVPDKEVTWMSEDENIVKVDNGKITGNNVGTTNVKVTTKNGISDSIKVIVTDIIRKPELDDNKSKVPCNKYSKEENELLDKILESRVAAEEPGSRAAMIQVLRFITLNFRYKVPYFFEHGRLNNTNGQRYVDGEGRYYHKGLYLNESKFKDLKAIHSGPAIWGCGLVNYDDEYGWKIGALYPNGLDCSGFVTWAMLNSGHDVGDIGSGISYGIDDMSDIGEMHELTYEYANARQYKVGDIVARDGHTALIAGLDDNYIYIAESLLKGVRINKLSYTDKKSDLYRLYGYINTLDNFYASEGIYTNMW